MIYRVDKTNMIRGMILDDIDRIMNVCDDYLGIGDVTFDIEFLPDLDALGYLYSGEDGFLMEISLDQTVESGLVTIAHEMVHMKQRIDNDEREYDVLEKEAEYIGLFIYTHAVSRQA